MSGRPAYPKLSTSHKGQTHSPGGNRVSSSADSATSPFGASRRPSTAYDQMSGRKRPTGPGSRGESPPAKRVLSAGATDRYAAPGSPPGQSSPLPSRHNSITGIDVPVPTGPAPKTRDGRRIDNSRHWNNAVRRDSLERRASNGSSRGAYDSAPYDTASPLHHANSPLSMLPEEIEHSGSGGSTPLNVAPPAPPMFPVTAKFSIQHFAHLVNLVNAENNSSRLTQQEQCEGRSGTISSLRNIKARKRAIAVSEVEKNKNRAGGLMVSQVSRAASTDKSTTNGPNAEERSSVARMQAEFKASQIEIDNLKKERKTMLSRVEELEKLRDLPTEVHTLSDRYKQLQMVPEQLNELEKLPNEVTQLQSTLHDLNHWRQSQVEPTIQDLVRTEILESFQQAMRSEMDTLQTKVETHVNDAKRASNNSPASSHKDDISTLFEFKRQLERESFGSQLRQLKEKLDKVDKHELKTHDRVGKLENQIPGMTDKLVKREDPIPEMWKTELRNELGKKIDEEIELFTNDLRSFIGPLREERDQSGKVALDRIRDLEASASTIQTLTMQQTKLSELVTQITKESPDIKQQDLGGDAVAQINAKLTEFDARMSAIEISTSANATITQVDDIKTKLTDIEARATAIEESTSASATTTQLDDIKATVQEILEKVHNGQSTTEEVATEVKAVRERTETIDKDRIAMLAPLESRISGVEQLTSKTQAVEDGYLELKSRIPILEQLASKTEAVEAGHAELESRISSVEQLASKTEAVEAANAELESRVSGVEQSASSRKSLRERQLAHLEKRVSTVESLSEEVNQMKSRIDEPTQFANRLSQLEREASKTKLSSLSKQDNDNLSNAIQKVDQKVEDIGEDFEKTQEEVHSLQNAVNFMTTGLNKVIEDIVEKEVQPIKDRLLEIQRQSSEQKSLVTTSQPSITAAERERLQTLPQDLQDLNHTTLGIQQWQTAAEDTLNKWNGAIQGLREEIKTRGQAIETSEQQLTILQRSLRSLEDRYNNITTENMYQQMVQWISGHYPSAPDFLNQLNTVQQELNVVKDFTNRSGWMVHNAQQLFALASHSQSLLNLVENAPALQQLRTTSEQTNRASENAQIAISKAEGVESKVKQQIDIVGKINKAMVALEGAASLIPDLQKTCKDLSDKLNAECRARIDTDNALRKDLNTEHTEWREQFRNFWPKREEAKTDIDELDMRLTRSEEGATELTNQLGNVRDSLSILSSLNVEHIKQLCTMQPQILTAIGEVQKEIKVGGSKIKWSLDFYELRRPE